MALDPRWKNPQGKTPEQLYDAIVQIVRELRKGDYLPAAISDAADIDYDNATSGLTATNVQDAIDENDGRLDALEAKPAGLVLLNSGTVTNQATLPIVLTSFTAYRGLLILLDLVPATDAVELRMRVSTNGGSSYDSGGTDYRWSATTWSDISVAAAGSTGDSSIGLAGNIGNGSSEGVDAEVILLSQTSTAKKPKVSSRSWTYGAPDTPVGRISSAHRNAAQDTDAVQFFMSSGNIASGSWALYGYA